MFNEDLKNQFIAWRTKSLNTVRVLTALFNAIEPFEMTYGHDVCAMSVGELQHVMDNVLGLRQSSKWLGVTMLREYFKWCVVNHVPGAGDSIDHINLAGLEKLKRQMVSGPLQLQCYLDQVFSPEKEETIDDTYRCFLWMAYCGLSQEEAVSIEDHQVDLNNLVIHTEERDFALYREAIPAFRNAIQLTSFQFFHANYTTRRDRVPGHLIMRGFRSDAKLMTIRSILSTRLAAALRDEKTPLQLSFHRVQLSGLFYRIYEQERAGIPADFTETAVEFTSGKEYELAEGKTIQQLQRKIAKEYMDDYRRWKLAFSI